VPPADAPGVRPTPQVLVNELGQRSTPAWVQCPPTAATSAGNKNSHYVVGGTAQDQALRCEKRTVRAVKLALGHGFGHAQVERARLAKYWSCGVVANAGAGLASDATSAVSDVAASKAAEDSVAFEVWEPRAENPEATRRQIPAQRIAAQLFDKLRNDALSGSGKNVTGAVVAVPATATAAEVAAFEAAAREAGFADVATIGADIAVALAHGFDKVPKTSGGALAAKQVPAANTAAVAGSKEAKDDACPLSPSGATALAPTKPARRILILDIGACSATASILLCTNGILQSVTAPVTQWGIGGWFIDDALVQLCAKQFQRQSRLDVTSSRRSLAKLRRACEKAKQSLSSAKESTISIEALCEGIDFRFRLNRSRFEAECMSAITDTLSPIDEASSRRVDGG
jgi:molecular chaperone DnaK (HSP70)